MCPWAPPRADRGRVISLQDITATVVADRLAHAAKLTLAGTLSASGPRLRNPSIPSSWSEMMEDLPATIRPRSA